MAALSDELLAFLDQADVGVLAVTRKDGSIHQSVVSHIVRDGRIYISTEPTRVKARAIARAGRASYSVHGDQRPYPSFTVEGPARVLDGEGIGALSTAIFAKISGTPAGEPIADEVIRSMNRVVLELEPQRVYAVTHFDA